MDAGVRRLGASPSAWMPEGDADSQANEQTHQEQGHLFLSGAQVTLQARGVRGENVYDAIKTRRDDGSACKPSDTFLGGTRFAALPSRQHLLDFCCHIDL